MNIRKKLRTFYKTEIEKETVVPNPYINKKRERLYIIKPALSYIATVLLIALIYFGGHKSDLATKITLGNNKHKTGKKIISNLKSIQTSLSHYLNKQKEH